MITIRSMTRDTPVRLYTSSCSHYALSPCAVAQMSPSYASAGRECYRWDAELPVGRGLTSVGGDGNEVGLVGPKPIGALRRLLFV